MNDALELATSDELVQELLRRETFVGIIIRPNGDVREYFNLEKMELAVQNMPQDVATTILAHAAISLTK